jgi:hypothetical protein
VPSFSTLALICTVLPFLDKVLLGESQVKFNSTAGLKSLLDKLNVFVAGVNGA